MQIFLPSQRISSPSKQSRGFTLVELLISLAIIGMIYATVLVNFASFDSVTILKSTAYEVAGTIREAQVLSISVIGVTAGSQLNFRSTYGVHFAKDSSDYIVFRDTTPVTGLNTPEYDRADTGVGDIFTYAMTRNTEVTEICVKRASISEECDVTSLDISFKRPEFAALFYAKKGTNGATEFTTTQNRAIESAKIKLKSENGTNVWTIEIGILGHISVRKEQGPLGTDG